MSVRQASSNDQTASRGISNRGIIDNVLGAASPERGLSWLDIGCGTGAFLRRVLGDWEPSSLHATDVLPWLPEDLMDDVAFEQAAAEEATLPVVDRVVMIETIEHLEAPWTALRRASAAVAPGGLLVVSSPNVGSLRSRLNLLLRGELAAFRADNAVHLTPALAHVIARILSEEGLEPEVRFGGPDVVPSTGRTWPEALHSRWPAVFSPTLIVVGRRGRRHIAI